MTHTPSYPPSPIGRRSARRVYLPNGRFIHLYIDDRIVRTLPCTPTNEDAADDWLALGDTWPTALARATFAPRVPPAFWLVFLAWIGLTRRERDGSWFVPFRWPPAHMWRIERGRWACGWRASARMTNWLPYTFRNLNCNPWWHNDNGHKRLLPFRWGFGWAGFEFGDRGGEHIPHARVRT